MFQGTHYLGLDMVAQFEEGETWKKVFGPVFIYLNSTPDATKAQNLWTDAKKQVLIIHLPTSRTLLLKFSIWPFAYLLMLYLAHPRGCLKRHCGLMILSHHPTMLLPKTAVQFLGDC